MPGEDGAPPPTTHIYTTDRVFQILSCELAAACDGDIDRYERLLFMIQSYAEGVVMDAFVKNEIVLSRLVRFAEEITSIRQAAVEEQIEERSLTPERFKH